MLEEHYLGNAYPGAQERKEIASRLGVDSEAVDNWSAHSS